MSKFVMEKLEKNKSFMEMMFEMMDDDDDGELNKVVSHKDNKGTCLISGTTLEDNHVTLKCNHSFNYENIFNEVCKQKNKFNRNFNETIKLRKNQIKCPYCRNVQHFLLPQRHPFAIIDGVNSPLELTQETNCIYKFKRGKRKGLFCGKKCRGKDGFCNRHKLKSSKSSKVPKARGPTIPIKLSPLKAPKKLGKVPKLVKSKEDKNEIIQMSSNIIIENKVVSDTNTKGKDKGKGKCKDESKSKGKSKSKDESKDKDKKKVKSKKGTYMGESETKRTEMYKLMNQIKLNGSDGYDKKLVSQCLKPRCLAPANAKGIKQGRHQCFRLISEEEQKKWSHCRYHRRFHDINYKNKLNN